MPVGDIRQKGPRRESKHYFVAGYLRTIRRIIFPPQVRERCFGSRLGEKGLLLRVSAFFTMVHK